MRGFYRAVVRRRALILTLFLLAAAAGLVLRQLVYVNYDVNDYLPEGTASTVSVHVLEREFDGGIPNVRVMVRDVTIPEALEYKARLAAAPGVQAVTWLDDGTDVTVPLSAMDADTLDAYYRDGAALFTVTVSETDYVRAIEAIRDIAGPDGAVTGSAASQADSATSTMGEVRLIGAFGVAFALVVLALTTTSWLEPILVLVGLGVAVFINSGTNLIFGEISFVTNAAGSILQMAVSLDYSVFLLHRFEECRAAIPDRNEAMVDALCKSTASILSSGLTTVIGFLALVLMRFGLGADLGLALAKGIVISLLTAFLFVPSMLLMACPLCDRLRHRRLVPRFDGFGRFVGRVTAPLALVFVLVIAPAYMASNANDFYYGSAQMYGPDSAYGRDTAAIEETFGRSDTYVLMVPGRDTAVQAALSRELHGLDHVTGVISYVDMAGAEVPLSYLDGDTLSQLMSGDYSRLVLTADVPAEGEEAFTLVEQVRAAAEKYYPGTYYLAGAGVSTYDLMDTVTSDLVKVNLVAIGAVFLVLLLTMRNLWLPVLLVLSIETAIWLNLAVPYFAGTPIFYITYLIISSIQLGATVDYAILLTNVYRENRGTLGRREAMEKTVAGTAVSILTSGSVLAVVGLLMGYLSSNRLLAQLGLLLGRGALFSLGIVLFVLPGLLCLTDRLVMGRRQISNGNKEKEGAKT